VDGFLQKSLISGAKEPYFSEKTSISSEKELYFRRKRALFLFLANLTQHA